MMPLGTGPGAAVAVTWWCGFGAHGGQHSPAPLLPSGHPLALPASVTLLPSPRAGPGLGVGTD